MDIRGKYTDTIIELMRSSVGKGSPLNPPVWWIDPTDPVAQLIDDGKKITSVLMYRFSIIFIFSNILCIICVLLYIQ